MEMNNEIEKVLDTIRPYLHQDGGDVELVEVQDNMDVILRLTGNCSSCSMSDMTMTAGIEETLRKSFPNLGKITAVKD